MDDLFLPNEEFSRLKLGLISNKLKLSQLEIRNKIKQSNLGQHTHYLNSIKHQTWGTLALTLNSHSYKFYKK